MALLGLIGDRIGLAGLAVFGAALAILLVIRAARRGPGQPDHRVGPRPSARPNPSTFTPTPARKTEPSCP
jgi:hypothetical protein